MCGKVAKLELERIRGDSELCGRGWNLPAQVKELVSNQKREVTSSGMRGKLAQMGTDINR